jgi:hypothetical protein
VVIVGLRSFTKVPAGDDLIPVKKSGNSLANLRKR